MERELKTKMPRFDKFILGVGLTVGILGIVLTLITDIEIYRPLRFFSIIIYLVYWYRDKNYKSKYLFMYIGSLIGTALILFLIAAFSIGILFDTIFDAVYEEFLLMLMIFLLIFFAIILPILDSYLYQKFKIMSYTNEELKKENESVREYLKREYLKEEIMKKNAEKEEESEEFKKEEK